MSIKHKKIIFRCFECQKNYENDFNKKLIKRFANTYKFCNGDINKFTFLLKKGVYPNKKLIKRFANTYKFCNGDINKFTFLLKKGVYPNEYMGCWERFVETLLTNKEAFYSNLNMEDITDADYRHTKRVFKNF